MSETVNAKTFDLGAVLAGQQYPTDTVDVYFDERSTYAIGKLREQVAKLEKANDERYDEVKAELDALIESLVERKYVFHLTGVPSSVRNAIFDKLEEEFPETKNEYGIVERNPERDEKFLLLMFQAYISKIVAPDGAAIESPSEAELKALRLEAPRHVVRAIEQGISALDARSTTGFETVVKSADFLSKP